MTDKPKLTNENIHTFKFPPEGKRKCEIPDSLITGLYLEVRMSGKSTFWFRWTNPTTRRLSHAKLGPGDALTLGQARSKARELRGTLALGGDPRGEREALKQIPLLTDFMENTYQPWTEETNKVSSSKRKEQHFRIHIKETLGNKKLNEITKADIKRLQSSVHNKGLSHASVNRVITTLKHALGHAYDLELIEKNPASRIKMHPEGGHKEVYLKDAQIKSLINVLKDWPNQDIALAIRFLICTGLRLNQCLAAKWCNYSEKDKTLFIPYEDNKNRKAYVIPLNSSAMEVINTLDTKDKYEYLYVNRVRNDRLHNFSRAWYKIRDKAGLSKDVKLHSLRHSFATALISKNVSLYTVQHLLNHSSPLVTQKYSHMQVGVMAEGSEKVSEVINEAMKEAS